MDRYVQRLPGPQPCKQQPQPGSSKQGRIDDLRKLVKLPMDKMAVTDVELQRLVAVLSSSRSTDACLVQALRQLGCYMISADLLAQVPVAKAVKQHRSHPSEDVRRLVERWLQHTKQRVLEEHRKRNHSGKLPDLLTRPQRQEQQHAAQQMLA